MPAPKTVQLSHGGGGLEMNQFIHQLFFNYFHNEILIKDEDAALLNLPSPFAMTTDSFTVSPISFAGGNIGSLAIAGTCNDLAMAGAKPEYLSCGFIIEEGMPFDLLETIVATMAQELQSIDAKIVCGDTKIVPKGSADQLYINTTGVGHVQQLGISSQNIQDDDVILVSRDIGCHGACVLAAREALRLEQPIDSDCAVLWPTVKALLDQHIQIRAMRDATRGGLSAVVNEWCQSSQVQLNLEESAIPINDHVRGVCELFGFEPYDLANEGTFVLSVAKQDAQTALEVLQQFNPNASMIGHAKKADSDGIPAKAIITSPWGSRRYLDFPVGELLPRIC